MFLDNTKNYPFTEYKKKYPILSPYEKNKEFCKSVNRNFNINNIIENNKVKYEKDKKNVNEEIRIKFQSENNMTNNETSEVDTGKKKWYMIILYILGFIILLPIILLCICCLLKYGEESFSEINYADYDSICFCCKCCKGCYCKDCCNKCCRKRKKKHKSYDNKK